MFPLVKYDNKEDSSIIKEYLAESYCVNKYDGDTFPQIYRMIDKYQRKDKELVAKKTRNYHT